MTLPRAIRPAVVLLISWPFLAPPNASPAGVAVGDDQDRPVFRAGTAAVRLDVIVTDRGGPVAGLTAQDFDVLDNGVAQKPELVARGDSVTVLPVFDTSDSIAGERLRALNAAARILVGLFRDDDRAGLLTFADRLVLRVPLGGGGRGSPTISEALDSVRASGSTAMYDALVVGLMLAAPDAGGALLLLFSDGADTSSYLKAHAALDAVKHSGVVVYVVASGLSAPATGPIYADTGMHEWFLRSIAEVSGGQLLRAEFTGKKLGGLFAQILSEFRTRYVLTYSPEGVGRNDGWHTLKVSLRRGASQAGAAPRGAEVRVRAGYYASGPAR